MTLASSPRSRRRPAGPPAAGSGGSGPAVDFLHALAPGDVPAAAFDAARRCLLDTIGVWAAGSGLAAARAVAELVREIHGAGGDAPSARIGFDGRRVAPPGAAMAGAAAIDAYDAHDGHRLTKGHAGVAVVPALLALADAAPGPAGGDGAEAMTRLVVGYEIATRAGIALHAGAADYHTSGAWNALGVAAMACRAGGHSRRETAHALGIAEYWAPRSPMMRVIDHPSMLKDGSAMGAQVGMTAAALARRGFTGAPAALLADDADGGVWGDLGGRWRITEQYLKPYPVCRWAQPAIEAAAGLRPAIAGRRIDRVRVESFAEAVRLACRRPLATDEAQYSLPFPVAAMLVRGRVGREEIDGSGLDDPEVLRLAASMALDRRPAFDELFPGQRWARVSVTLADGSVIASEPMQAAGDPERPLTDAAVVEKFRANCRGLPEDRISGLLEAVETLAARPDSTRLGDLVAAARS